jgi:nitrogen regulatory protein PII
MRCGKQNGYTEFVRGTEIAITMLPKIKIEVIASS